MRYTISNTALSNKLMALSKVISNKSSLPILGDSVFDVASNSALYNGGVDVIILVIGKAAIDKATAVIKVVNSKQVEQISAFIILLGSITLQSDDSYAERGYHQQDQTQEEGNDAQRGRCKARRGVFRTPWAGGVYEGVRQDEGDVFWQSRLARHRKRCEGLLLGKEKTESGGCRRAGKENQSNVGRCTKKWNCYQSAELDAREQSQGRLLSIYIKTTGGRK